MSKNRLTSGTALVGRVQVAGGSEFLSGAGAPTSGTSGTKAAAGSFYFNVSNGVVYANEGTEAAPYWTPVSFDQRGLFAWHTDFRDAQGKGVTDTAALKTLTGSGIKIFGQGIAEAADSGLVVAIDDQGAVASLSTTDEAAHTAALGVGETTDVPFQPDQNGPLVLDVELTNKTAITLRALFIGWAGALADALDPIVTGATTTLTLVLDDLAGLFFDVGLSDVDRLFAPHNKSNEAATIETTATGVDTSTDIAAAGTHQRFRVEISAAGVMTCFVDKVQVTQIAASLDADEEVGPVVVLETTENVGKVIDVRRFSAWGNRVA